MTNQLPTFILSTGIATVYFAAQNFQDFHEKICLRENIIVNITAYSVIIFFDTCLIHEIKNRKILF